MATIFRCRSSAKVRAIFSVVVVLPSPVTLLVIARIIGAFFTTRNDSTLIDLTLKINNIDLNPVIQTFERYNYTIKATFAEKTTWMT